MVTINALACAGLHRLADGEWQLHSRFTQAINYQHSQGALLTLFRHGKGMGPTGVLLSGAQFARVMHVDGFIKQGTTLWGQGVTLRPSRQLHLQVKAGAIAGLDLSSVTHVSGLCGALNHPPGYEPLACAIIAQLERGLQGEQPDWRWLIGYGPGLTPSGDDILTGIAAVLHATGLFARIPSFLPPADQLAQLTTSVSCSYLNSAGMGEFSTPVLKVIRRLQSGRCPQSAIGRLLAVGHTSGADILLGIALAQRWLQGLDSRGMHARSGNYTHVYSGCRNGEFFPGGQFIT
ncbi:DUF2877 domain-containing protein [Enterobacteriaceae bacterium 4M9]|nr:DUF2877 domain-containing protein [Enterobacteriaceae bacterium 4M9]